MLARRAPVARPRSGIDAALRTPRASTTWSMGFAQRRPMDRAKRRPAVAESWQPPRTRIARAWNGRLRLRLGSATGRTCARIGAHLPLQVTRPQLARLVVPVLCCRSSRRAARRRRRCARTCPGSGARLALRTQPRPAARRASSQNVTPSWVRAPGCRTCAALVPHRRQLPRRRWPDAARARVLLGGRSRLVGCFRQSSLQPGRLDVDVVCAGRLIAANERW